MYRKTATEKILSWGTAVSILLLWLIVSEFGLIDQNLVPTPQAVFAAFIEIMENGYKNFTLLEHLGESRKRLVIAVVLSCVTEVPLGIASGYNSRIRAIFEPIIEFYRPLPPLAYYTLLVLWMGIENESKISLLYLACFAPAYISCVSAVIKIREDYINSAFTVGASRLQVIVHVIFPACLPDIFTGLRTSLGVAYTTLVSAEMVAANSGIGWMVLDASRYLRSDIIFLGIIVMGITGILLDRGIQRIERRVVPWKGKE